MHNGENMKHQKRENTGSIVLIPEMNIIIYYYYGWIYGVIYWSWYCGDQSNTLVLHVGFFCCTDSSRVSWDLESLFLKGYTNNTLSFKTPF